MARFGEWRSASRLVADVPVRMPDQVPMAIVVRRLARVRGIDRLDAEQAADPAKDAADRTPNHRTNRAGGLAPHCGAVGGAIGNTLSLGRNRGGQ